MVNIFILLDLIRYYFNIFTTTVIRAVFSICKNIVSFWHECYAGFIKQV